VPPAVVGAHRIACLCEGGRRRHDLLHAPKPIRPDFNFLLWPVAGEEEEEGRKKVKEEEGEEETSRVEGR
jgi:hypothetical protein